MHPSAMDNARLFFESYVGTSRPATVMDLGSQDVNGSLRSLCPANVTYTGVDFVKGRNVDVVLQDAYVFPFEDDSFDYVICSSVFEHSEFFWVLLLEVLRVLKRTGVFYLNVPSNGMFHRFPVDCWRFYPDSGNALVRWANRNGHDACLLESFIGQQGTDYWNDFVAVILKDRASLQDHVNRILHKKTDYMNGLLADASGRQQGFFNPASHSEDQLRIRGTPFTPGDGKLR